MSGQRALLRRRLEEFGSLWPRILRLWQPIPGRDAQALRARAYRRRELKRLLSQTDPVFFAAIHAALCQTLAEPGGAERVQLEELVSFRRSHTLAGAALLLHCHPNTAGNWHRAFLKKILIELERFSSLDTV